MSEQWRPIVGLEDRYDVSNYGRVRNKDLHIMKQRTMRGYRLIHLSRNKKSFHKQVHRLVAEVFILNPKNKPQVNHIDGNRGNNHVSNLEWVTASENIKHAFKLGNKNQKGEKNNQSKLSVQEILDIRMCHKEGLLQKDIAKMYGVSRANVCLIVNGKAWVHLK